MLKLFLRWFFGIRGSSPNNPLIDGEKLPLVGAMIGSMRLFWDPYRLCKCMVCERLYYTLRKPGKESKVCLSWNCYRKYHSQDPAPKELSYD